MTNIETYINNLEENTHTINVLRVSSCSLNYLPEVTRFKHLWILNCSNNQLHTFCHLYYCLKFKTQFRDLLWKKIREAKIIQNYHPSYLKQLLTDENENVDINMVLNSWV